MYAVLGQVLKKVRMRRCTVVRRDEPDLSVTKAFTLTSILSLQGRGGQRFSDSNERCYQMRLYRKKTTFHWNVATHGTFLPEGF
jgi:hypothetical protein